MTHILYTIEELKKQRATHNGPVVLVPTMGALHEGHLSLVRLAQQIPAATVIVSIFVNPLQFAEGEDLDAYPRTLEADVDKLTAVGADYVFAPNPRDMYPQGPRTTIHPGPAGTVLEGASRPTHFAGVLTVVHKLFALTNCTHAIFGEKDYQQLLLIKQMVADLNLNVNIIAAPIVREKSGLAKSSRNQYLSTEQTQLATTLWRALAAGQQQHTKETILHAAQAIFEAEPDIKLDYLALRHNDLVSEPTAGENRLLVAATVGETRLIDNVAVTLN
ncbi:MAG: pantoate--beta-alanine ligase [Corynebacterium sp.]|uniref:pantoate--beta-alanine ligase n=1 Tax=Corynebacterium sp. TaxID=1720 RepID=UPI0026DAE428|nr:pantoate--beta-alanine ligase [Corynebacterium sp.]MDO4762491.1 pantoate--beta-alanine ligase [Corynebacterium sp.]